jgi:hypothetical protein
MRVYLVVGKLGERVGGSPVAQAAVAYLDRGVDAGHTVGDVRFGVGRFALREAMRKRIGKLGFDGEHVEIAVGRSAEAPDCGTASTPEPGLQ